MTERLILHTLSPPLVALLAAADWEAARATDPPYDISDDTFSEDEQMDKIDGLEWVHRLELRAPNAHSRSVPGTR